MTTPSAGAMRAAKLILRADEWGVEEIAQAIDEETNHAALVEAAKSAMMTAHGYNKFCNGTFEECANCRDWRAAISQEGA